MDSMRSLNTSLPTSQPSRPAPPEQLLQAFRTAALSVTNLYKSAVTDQSNSRQEGYQDALDDLLTFLDKENLGLQDGEGWTVRQWATERYERSSTGVQQPDSDDEPNEPEKRPRSASPVVTRPANEETVQTDDRSTNTDNASPSNDSINQVTEPPTMFTFTAAQPSQIDTAMQTDENSSSTLGDSESQSMSAPPAAVRVEFVQRGARTPNRHGSPRNSTKTTTREFTFSSSTKRKLQFPDFFDISNLGSGREGSGGGKRGRYA